MEAMEGDCSFEGAACTVGRKVLFKFKRSHTMRQLPCDGVKGSGRVIPGIGKGGASLGEESGRILPRNWIQAFRKVLLVVQGLSPDWVEFPGSSAAHLRHLSLQKSDSISFMCSLSNLWCCNSNTTE